MDEATSAACRGKQRFNSPEPARRVARIAGRRTDSSIDVYRCQYCAGWHVGGRSGGKPKERR